MKLQRTAGWALLALLSATGVFAQGPTSGPPLPPDILTTWQFPIKVTSDSPQANPSLNSLTIGTDPAASDGFDSNDLQGSLGSPINFAAIYILHLNGVDSWNGPTGDYIQDIRGPVAVGTPKIWNNVTVASDLGSPTAPAHVTLTWGNLAGIVDPAIQLVLSDGTNQINMVTQASYTFPVTGGNDGVAATKVFSITATNTTATQAPVISNLQAVNVTSSGFQVSFNTDVATGATLIYGSSPTSLSNTVSLSTASTSHQFPALTGLTPNTTYYYQVSTSQPGFLSSTSAVQNVSTLNVLSLVGMLNITPSDTSATITYQTNAPATALVQYGTSQTTLNQQVTVAQANASQSITLPGLTPSTQYFVQVTSSAPGYAPLVSAVTPVTTLGTFTLSAPTVSNVTATSATVMVTTSQPTTATLQYGTTSLSQTLSNPTPATTQQFNLTGLQPGTAYQFQVSATGTGLPTMTSSVIPFTTLQTFQISQPPTVTNITSTGATIGLTTSVPVTATLQYGANGTLSQSSGITTATSSPSFTLTNLLPGTTYQFQLQLQAPGFEAITTAPQAFTTLTHTFGSGDVNGDGKVNIADAILAAQIAIGAIQPTAAQAAAADVVAPAGSVDVGDVVWILKLALGLVAPGSTP